MYILENNVRWNDHQLTFNVLLDGTWEYMES